MADQEQQQRVVVGMDPHKRSVTIEVMTAEETVLGGGRYGTDPAGFAAMRRAVSQFPNRVWAIEGCSGIGRHVAQRLLAAGEEVVDVPPKLSAKVRVFATGQGRKTDATDAHSIALVGTQMAGLRPVVNDEQLAILRILADRRRSLGEEHTRMVTDAHAPRRQGWTISAIARHLGRDRKTIRAYLADERLAASRNPAGPDPSSGSLTTSGRG